MTPASSIETQVEQPTAWYDKGGKWGRVHIGFLATDWIRNVATLAAVLLAFAAIASQNSNSNELVEKQNSHQEENNKLTREMNTDNMWTNYMELAIQYPNFADGAEYSQLRSEEQTQYSWFVERLFYTGESILKFTPDKEAWISVFKTEAAKHRSLIEGHPKFLPEYFCDYDPAMRDIIAAVSEKAENRQRECVRLGAMAVGLPPKVEK